MPPKSKYKKIETRNSHIHVTENRTEDETGSMDEEYSNDYNAGSDKADEYTSSEIEEEENDEDSMSDLTVSDTLGIVPINSNTNHLYNRPIMNIKDILNAPVSEIKGKKDASDKNEPVFKNVTRKWGWKQEIMLLEGIETYGFCKWDLIAAKMSKRSWKSFKAEEVKNHYYQYYYNGTLGQVWNYDLGVKELKHVDHTDPVVISPTHEYLPQVAPSNLRDIKFLPHRGDFEEYPPNEIEMMATRVDFSSHYMNYLKRFNLDQEIRSLQLAIVDAYRRVVSDRIKMYKLMKEFKLIEQFFNKDAKILKKCEVERFFHKLQKFVVFFDSPDEFLKFYFNCLKEKILKLEIHRRCQMLNTKKHIERHPEAKLMLKRKAPSFLDVGQLLKENEGLVLQKPKKRKNKSKFTRRKGTR